MSCTADLISRISAAALAAGIPPAMALAVVEQESQCNPAARGTSGEVGLFQLMPNTAAGLGVDPYDIDQNIAGGCRYLAQLYSKYGDWGTALGAYNWGPGKMDQALAGTKSIPSVVQSYAKNVLNNACIVDSSTCPVFIQVAGPSPVGTTPAPDWASVAAIGAGALVLLLALT